MNNIEAIRRINEREKELGIAGTSASWHAQYADCTTVYVGGLPDALTESDVRSIFEQHGTVVHVNIVRDQRTGKPRGFGFVDYSDPRSAVLAVDNLNGFEVLNRTLGVDHAEGYVYPENAIIYKSKPEPCVQEQRVPKEGTGRRMGETMRTELEMQDASGREEKVMQRLREMRRARALEEREERQDAREKKVLVDSGSMIVQRNDGASDREAERRRQRKEEKRLVKLRYQEQRLWRRNERARIREQRQKRRELRAARENESL